MYDAGAAILFIDIVHARECRWHKEAPRNIVVCRCAWPCARWPMRCCGCVSGCGVTETVPVTGVGVCAGPSRFDLSVCGGPSRLGVAGGRAF